MPYINKDGTIDKECNGYIIKCDICGLIVKIYNEDYDDFTDIGREINNINMEIMELFKGVRKHDIPECMCLECSKKLLPGLIELRDVIELDIYVNRLRRKINEKCKQN